MGGTLKNADMQPCWAG